MTQVYKAINAVMSDMSKVGISKEKQNQQQGFKYRGIDDAVNALAPLLVKHGLLVLPRVLHREVTERESRNGGALFYVVLKMEFDFVAIEDDSKHVVGPLIGEAMDSGDKASNKAMSVAFKYACFQAFCIPTEATAIDPDADIHTVLTPAQKLGKAFVEALAAGIDDRIFEVYELARTDKRTLDTAWNLLTAEEKKGIDAAMRRSIAARKTA